MENAQAIIDVVANLSEPVSVPIAGGEVIVLPEGKELHSLKRFVDELRARPERRRGTATLTDLASFCDYVNRWKADNSIVFADDNRTAPALVGIINHHAAGYAGDPECGDHRAGYTFPISEEWKTWNAQNGQAMAQGDFAAFIEDHMADLVAPPADVDADPLFQIVQGLAGTFASPSKIVELSRGLAVHVNEQVKQAVNLQTGEVQVQYEAEHRDGTGASLKAPGWFLIAIPVFRNGPLYRIGVRLRYRVGGGKIAWFYQLFRADKIIDHAITEAVGKVKEKTGLAVMIGTPEK